ncbi:MAG TPA: SRPBCC family protein [Kofleriaceae bacterium]|nr:SRPBCC family protein [Kofleriaceae bacterium]
MNETTLEVPPGQPTLKITRWFDAPQHLVWKAVTTPALVQRWWAPPCVELLSCEMDVRVGGAWRFLTRSPQGEVGFRGEYREIAPPHRIVQTFIFEPIPDSVAIETMTLIADGARTQLVVDVVHPSVAARDAHVASGMETGMRQAHAQLEAIVQELQRAAA